MKKLSYLIVAGALAVFATSCNKSEPVVSSQEETTTVVADENATEVTASEADAIVDEAFTLQAAGQLRSASTADTLTFLNTSCPTITLDTTKTVKTLTIDFGTSCTGKDGKIRSGKIIVTSTNFSKTNVDRKITFNAYKVNDKTISGSITKTITNRTLLTRQANVKDSISVTFPNAGTATRISDQTRIYRLASIETWGSVTFTGVKGNVITKTVSESTPLIYRMACRQIVKGIQVITRNAKTITIDFGDGTCDNEATATDGTKTWTIKL